MYTVITFYIVGYLFFAYSNYKEYFFSWFDDWAMVLGLPILQAFLFGLIGLVIAIALPVKYETTSWTEKIVALKDNTSSKGRYFLGSGMINGSMNYVYYLQNNDSTFQMFIAHYDDAKIRYVNTQPRVVITDVQPAKNTFNKWAADLNEETNQ